MFILINDAKTEIDDNLILPVIPMEAPAGWSWVDVNDAFAKPLIEKKARENYDIERLQAYLDAGITPGSMIIALWERVVENRPQLSDEMQAKRLEIKEKYPKP